MTIDFAIVDDPKSLIAWQSMASAPRNRPVLIRSRWGGERIALVGSYRHEHGGFCTQPFFGQGEQMINAEGWTEIPDLDGGF
jgi:hypothetical protein